jgi:hypothetical protein
MPTARLYNNNNDRSFCVSCLLAAATQSADGQARDFPFYEGFRMPAAHERCSMHGRPTRGVHGCVTFFTFLRTQV